MFPAGLNFCEFVSRLIKGLEHPSMELQQIGIVDLEHVVKFWVPARLNKLLKRTMDDGNGTENIHGTLVMDQKGKQYLDTRMGKEREREWLNAVSGQRMKESRKRQNGSGLGTRRRLKVQNINLNLRIGALGPDAKR